MSAIHVRLGRLQDSVQYNLGRFLEDFEAARENHRR